MYKIIFYKNKSGKEPVKEYISDLMAQQGKDSKIRIKKIQDYLNLLRKKGTYAGEPYVKYMGDGIWELRPLSERIFFFLWNKNTIVLLHCYYKKSKRTPKKEIMIAQKRKNEFMERMALYEQEENK